jgi:predicted SAM-dependent methyltransferase
MVYGPAEYTAKMPGRLRESARKSKTLRTVYHYGRWIIRSVERRRMDFETMPARVAVDLAYQAVLRRPADDGGRQNALYLRGEGWTNNEIIDLMHSSSEYHREIGYPGRLLPIALHSSRCQFIHSLPPGDVIVDLGGTDQGDPSGALVAMGYPYRFKSLTIIDLPSEDRHDNYKSFSVDEVVETRLGPVNYRYHSMTDLSAFADSSVDLVYSGQSIEHVTPEEGLSVLQEVARILRPGGHIAIDTPNGRVARLQKEEFLDPDHKVEYTLEELTSLVEKAGLEVVEVKGANYSGAGLEAGRFDFDEVGRNHGLYWDAAACYLLCLVARKP